MYEIRLARRAARYYQRVDVDTAKRLDGCFTDLSRSPFRAGDVRPIRGRPGLFRYRVGGLRVLFDVDRRDRVVRILAIVPRGDAY